MFDLARICPTEAYKTIHPLCGAPANIGLWRYATDGHICIRLPRRRGCKPGVRQQGSPKCEGLPWPENTQWKAMKPEPLPKMIEAFGIVACPKCGGDGCRSCKFEGEVSGTFFRELTIGGVLVTIRKCYADILKDLPSLLVATARNGTMIVFRFKGGEGLLMTVDTGRHNA